MPHTGTQCGQPSSVVGPAAFRFAASACVVMPVAAQNTAAIATIRAIVILSSMVGPVSGGLTNKTGGIDVTQPKTTRKGTAQIALHPRERFEQSIALAPEKRGGQCPLWVKSR